MLNMEKNPQQLLEEALEHLSSITKEDIQNMSAEEKREFEEQAELLNEKVASLGQAIEKNRSK